MTDDPFVLLGLPARPALDVAAIKAAHHRLAVRHHPDAQDATDGLMSLLNEARSILEDVPTRLRLLASTRPAATTPLAREEPDWAFAQKLASACEAASAWTQSFEAAGSPLQKAILLAKLPACRATLDEISQMLETRAGSLKERLHEIDTRWPEVAREDLESLADAWTFWKRQQTRFHESLLSIEAAAPA